MKHRYLLGAGVALAMAFSWANAQAQLVSMPAGPGAWYFGGEGGWSALDNAKDRTAGFSASQKFNDGFNVGLRAGYEWGPWRFEEEFSYRRNSNSSITVTAPAASAGTFAIKGGRDTYAFMTNAIYDFTLGWPITPHIGGGIGAVDLHEGISTVPGVSVVSSSDWVFGYQGIAGVRYNINPALAFDLDYRYLATLDPTFKVKAAFGGGSYKSEHSSHSIVASLSVRFGAPPPPAVAPPAPPAPPIVTRKVFLVFFDWDKSTITPEGMQIIQQAAAAFRSGAPVTIQVTGYTDRSGSPGYNQRLSERRADAVARALERSGVPRSQMAVSGRGENDNRVPTADGVREPQNRRVEIVFP